MREELIKERIDRNILDLLTNMKITECINKLNQIVTNFETKNQEINDSITRKKYINIYIEHTKKRIETLHDTSNRHEFKRKLYRETLQNSEHKPTCISNKYRLLTN